MASAEARPSITSSLEKPKKNASWRSSSVTRTVSPIVSESRVASSSPAKPAPRIRTCRFMGAPAYPPVTPRTGPRAASVAGGDAGGDDPRGCRSDDRARGGGVLAGERVQVALDERAEALGVVAGEADGLGGGADRERDRDRLLGVLADEHV